MDPIATSPHRHSAPAPAHTIDTHTHIHIYIAPREAMPRNLVIVLVLLCALVHTALAQWCTSAAQCGTASCCKNGVCMSASTGDDCSGASCMHETQCGDNYVCHTNICTRVCTSYTDCDGGHCCSTEGFCAPPLADNACVGGQCRYSTDCEVSEMCKSHVCKPISPSVDPTNRIALVVGLSVGGFLLLFVIGPIVLCLCLRVGYCSSRRRHADTVHGTTIAVVSTNRNAVAYQQI